MAVIASTKACGNLHVQKARKELARAEKARAERAKIIFFY